MGDARHVVLVGLPGAGKSAVGRVVAARLARPFVDFDEEIVRREGRSVADIFADAGEAHFRGLEAALTREALDWPAAVLSPGGGWIVQPGSGALIAPRATLVHLRVAPGVALERLRGSGVVRPLLASSEPLASIESLWRQRRAMYERAEVQIVAEGVDAQGVADRVVAALRDCW